MAEAVLNYNARIERMENKRWVKQIFEWNLSESLWEKICWGHARKLKIQKTVRVRIGRPFEERVIFCSSCFVGVFFEGSDTIVFAACKFIHKHDENRFRLGPRWRTRTENLKSVKLKLKPVRERLKARIELLLTGR
ncbi:hypothetical protein FHG87_015770 [Trinorchestia longiramus]|nr:hypothetical protein FHG87_015770 [Trinorchestia longiramus]